MLILALLLNHMAFKSDSISFHAKHEDKVKCLNLIDNVYYIEGPKLKFMIYYYYVRQQKIMAEK